MTPVNNLCFNLDQVSVSTQAPESRVTATALLDKLLEKIIVLIRQATTMSANVNHDELSYSRTKILHLNKSWSAVVRIVVRQRQDGC